MRNVMVILAAVAGVVAAIVLGIMAAAGVSIFSANVQARVAKATLNPGVTIAVFNPQNKLQSQAYFENTYADFKGFLTQIRIVRAGGASAYNQTNLQGLRLECVQTAQAYNAASRSISTEAFKTADLPVALDSGRCAS